MDVLKDYEFEETYIDAFWIEKTRTVKADPKSMLRQVFDESNKVVTQNARWDIIPDYKSRAQLKIKLLEGMGVVKWKQVEVKVNFLNLLFWQS
jgi:hypothetical protein